MGRALLQPESHFKMPPKTGKPVAGYGIHGGNYQGFVAIVPEPNTVAFLFVGFLGFVHKGRKFRKFQ